MEAKKSSSTTTVAPLKKNTSSPIFARAFKTKHLKKHSSLLVPADPAKGILVTTSITGETRALGQVRTLLDYFLPTLYPNYILVPRAAKLTPHEEPDVEDSRGKRKRAQEEESKKKKRLGNVHGGAGVSGIIQEKVCEQNEDESANKCEQVAGIGKVKENQEEEEEQEEEEPEKISEVRDKKSSKFESVNTAVSGLIFFRFRVDVDPVEFLTKVFDHIAGLPKDEQDRWLQNTNSCHRWLPINSTFAARPDLLAELGSPIISSSSLLRAVNEKYPSIAIVAESRNNEDMKKSEIIKGLEPALPKHCKIDLKTPDCVIFVSVFKSVCALSVLPFYYRFKKYNLRLYLDSVKSNDPDGIEEIN